MGMKHRRKWGVAGDGQHPSAPVPRRGAPWLGGGLTLSLCAAPATSHRTSTIIFKCDEDADVGRPQVFSEVRGCEVTFEWKTKVVCPPKKMECKFVHKHRTYDLRLLSSLTGSWSFVHDGAS